MTIDYLLAPPTLGRFCPDEQTPSIGGLRSVAGIHCSVLVRQRRLHEQGRILFQARRSNVRSDDRLRRCGVSQRSECLTEFQDDCCQSDGSCGQRASNQQEETELEAVITDCSAALATFDCSELEAGEAPVACGGTSTAYFAGSLPSLKTGIVAASARQMGGAAQQRLRSLR